MKKQNKPGSYNPHRAWRFIWSGFLILMAIALVGGYWAFHYLTNVEVVSQAWIREQEVQTIHLNRAGLAKVGEWLAGKSEPTKPQPEPVSELEPESDKLEK